MHGDDGERNRSPDTGLFLTVSSLASVLRLLALIAVFFVRAAPPRCPASLPRPPGDTKLEPGGNNPRHNRVGGAEQSSIPPSHRRHVTGAVR